jgi:hypothetical protein
MACDKISRQKTDRVIGTRNAPREHGGSLAEAGDDDHLTKIYTVNRGKLMVGDVKQTVGDDENSAERAFNDTGH